VTRVSSPGQKVQYLCAFTDLADGAGRGFTLMLEFGAREIVVVRRGDQVFGYVNSCPHTGVTLNWRDNEFMSFDGMYIQCSMHFAQFRVYDGYCVQGPCAGRILQSVTVRVNNGEVWYCGENELC
jgi:nitrite reductase/ring-hydroxylating ferredoxin subunit